jgi:hypothetical protein
MEEDKRSVGWCEGANWCEIGSFGTDTTQNKTPTKHTPLARKSLSLLNLRRHRVAATRDLEYRLFRTCNGPSARTTSSVHSDSESESACHFASAGVGSCALRHALRIFETTSRTALDTPYAEHEMGREPPARVLLAPGPHTLARCARRHGRRVALRDTRCHSTNVAAHGRGGWHRLEIRASWRGRQRHDVRRGSGQWRHNFRRRPSKAATQQRPATFARAVDRLRAYCVASSPIHCQGRGRHVAASTWPRVTTEARHGRTAGATAERFGSSAALLGRPRVVPLGAGGAAATWLCLQIWQARATMHDYRARHSPRAEGRSYTATRAPNTAVPRLEPHYGWAIRVCKRPSGICDAECD